MTVILTYLQVMYIDTFFLFIKTFSAPAKKKNLSDQEKVTKLFSRRKDWCLVLLPQPLTFKMHMKNPVPTAI